MTARRLLVTTVCLALTTVGCSSIRNFTGGGQRRVQPTKSSEIDHFVQRWNANANQIDSLLCDSVDVTGRAEGKPIPLTARLGYQQPNKFRMTGTSIGGKSEVDLGSNPEEIWFWVARAKPPAVYFCKREDFRNVKIAMPFHPDWIVDMLGVSPIDQSKFQPDAATADFFTLVANETTPTGHTVIKRLVVDRETGRLAAIELFDPNKRDRPLVEATIRDYYEDPNTGLFVPSKVRMIWPDSDTKLTVTLPHRRIQLNAISPQLADSIFQRRDGDYLNTEVVNLANPQGRSTMPVSAQRPTTADTRGYDAGVRRANGTRLRGTIETN